jgi:hypothetical protein
MGLKTYVWVILSVIAAAVAFLGHASEGVPFMLGTALGIFLFPALILGVVILVARLFKTSPSPSTRRAIFLPIYGLAVVGQLSLIGSQDRRSGPAIGMAACMKAARDSAKYDIDAVMDVRKYCECAMAKLAEGERLDDATLAQMRDRNSVFVHEVMWPCAEAAMYPTTASKGGVIGNLERDTIPVMNTPRGIKVKVGMGKQQYYFLFDSGASDIMVSTGLEGTLASSGAITGYLDSMAYEMANGDIIQCRRAIVNDIHIGSFKVDSTVVAIYDGEIDYLLGKSFLDKFGSWSFIENGDKLILVK